MSDILIHGMEMPTSCRACMFSRTDIRNVDWCVLTEKDLPCDCPIVPVPKHSGLFDVGQFEKGCFYGYGHDGKVYKLLWDIKVFDGAKKFYINPIIPADPAKEVE